MQSVGGVVPVIWRLEVANALATIKQRGRMTDEDAAQALSHLSLMPIERDAETWPRAWSDTLGLAEAHRLNVYDAAYLELAQRRGLPPATLDKNCTRRRAACGVPVA